MFLVPQKRELWSPSARQSIYGIETKTRWRLTARLNDGHPIWIGWFDDRDDADAFLYAIAVGNLSTERELWQLPMPWWSPDIGEDLSYEFATVSFITTTSGSNQSYSVPSDWNNSNNQVETIASGGGGATGIANTNGGTFSGASGGGGAGYSKALNLTLTPGGTATFHLEAGGAVATAGGDCWFNGTTLAGSSVGSKGGGAGICTLGTAVSGGTGGASASGIGSTKTSGGNGGAISDSNYRAGAGGGGAGGPTNNGAQGGDGTGSGVQGGTGGGGSNNGSAGATGTGNHPATGGNGGNGGGGTGGGAGGSGVAGGNATANSGGAGAGGGQTSGGVGQNAGNGANDQAFDTTHGAGGGGGGGGSGDVSASGNGGTPGSYGGGGGGGGSCNSGGTAGLGAAGFQALIVVTYTPSARQNFIPGPQWEFIKFKPEIVSY